MGVTGYETCAVLEAGRQAAVTHFITSVRVRTFLPFSHAVKARAMRLAVCAVVLESCASQRPCHSLERPPPVDTALHTAELGSAPKAVAYPSDAAADPQPETASSAAVPAHRSAPEVELELPYPTDDRPRAISPELPSGDDEALARWNVGGSSDSSYVPSRSTYHPGTRVEVYARLARHRPGVATQGTTHQQALTIDRVQAQARSHGYWPFRFCFEAAHRQKPSTGGETRVAFMIDARGQVSHARLLDSKLDDFATSACLVREAAKLDFARRSHPIQIVLSIGVWPGDEERPALPAAEAPRVVGADFDPEAVRARLAERLGALITCFAHARTTDAALWGRLALATILEVDGTVHRVSEVESRFPNAAAVRCVQAVVADISFPSVNGKPFSLVLPVRLLPSLSSSPASPRTTPGPE